MTETVAIVDAWMQHPNPGMLLHPMFESLRRWPTHWRDLAGSVDTAVRVETTIARMDEAGVEKALLSAWWGPVGEMIGNDEVAGCVARYPGRLAGIASVDLLDPMAAVRELRRCVKELNFVGLRVLPWLWGLPPDDRRYYPLYAECVELGVPFCLQVGHAGPLCASEPGRPIPHLDNVALDFPELKIVGGHIGVPWLDEMLSLAMKYPNIYIDTSAYKASRYPADFVTYMRGPGRRKVMFGSNYPMLTPADCLESLESLELDDETRQLFLHDNASRVFGI